MNHRQRFFYGPGGLLLLPISVVGVFVTFGLIGVIEWVGEVLVNAVTK